MRFTFVDRILELQPGVSITTAKCLSMGEDYLADHFPRFPVMPGVLMLEAMIEAGAWLVRSTEDFAHSIVTVTLKKARNVRYSDFVLPGRVLVITAEVLSLDPREAQLKTQGAVDGKEAVEGRLVLERYNLADTRPELAATDEYLKRTQRTQFTQLYQPNFEVDSADESVLIASTHAEVQPGQGKV
jgi:3-hydroxyacyl-[acyl-carrier-protein] dehydratase